MSSSLPKQLEDFPHFLVTGVKEGGGAAPDGYIPLDISGVFDKLEGVREGRCWLLLAGRQSLIGDLSSLDSNSKTALYSTFEKTIPALVGCRLPYLEGYWQAYHIWMVADADQPWQELVFHASDAVSFSCEGAEGRALRGLRKAKPEDSGNPELQIVHNGWDHEHCELCNRHIDPDDCCYRNADGYWVCQLCHQKYIRPHDLSFVDEL
jgi:hypothetical protein